MPCEDGNRGGTGDGLNYLALICQRPGRQRSGRLLFGNAAMQQSIAAMQKRLFNK